VSAPPVLGSASLNGPGERVGRHAVDAERAPGGRPGDGGEANGHHPLEHKTVALPAFITGRRDEGKAESPRPQAGDKLPPSERGMLVFVAALLALGTVAVVVMLGFGGLTTHHPPAPTQPSETPAAGAPVADPSPSPSDSPSPSPSPSLSPSPKPSSRKPTPTPLGGVDLNRFCSAVARNTFPTPPNNDNSTWTCVDRSNEVRRTFTPDQVCIFQYPQATHAVVGSLTNPATWKCYP
jgi:hypothetical protein